MFRKKAKSDFTFEWKVTDMGKKKPDKLNIACHILVGILCVTSANPQLFILNYTKAQVVFKSADLIKEVIKSL